MIPFIITYTLIPPLLHPGPYLAHQKPFILQEGLRKSTLVGLHTSHPRQHPDQTGAFPRWRSRPRSVFAEAIAQACGIQTRADLLQIERQFGTADVHPFPEMTDVIPGIAHAQENITTESANGVGLEIVVTDETKIEIGRGVQVGITIMNDEVGVLYLQCGARALLTFRS